MFYDTEYHTVTTGKISSKRAISCGARMRIIPIFLGQTNLLLGNHDNVFKALQIKFYSEKDGSNDGS